MKKQILVPIDLSENSKAGLSAAIKIAEKSDAVINLMHIIEEESPVYINTTADMTLSHEVKNERNRYLAELTRKKHNELSKFLKPYNPKNLELKNYIAVGSYTECMRDMVNQHNIGFIVMSTSGETSVTEFISGGYTEKTVREAPVPVLSIKHESNLEKIDTLGFLIDLDQPNEKLIELINSLTDVLQTELILLHMKELEFLKDNELIVHLRLLAREYGLKPKVIQVINSNYDKLYDLRELIEKHNIDILAKTVDKQSAIARLFLRNNSEELIKEIEKPTLLMAR